MPEPMSWYHEPFSRQTQWSRNSASQCSVERMSSSDRRVGHDRVLRVLLHDVERIVGGRRETRELSAVAAARVEDVGRSIVIDRATRPAAVAVRAVRVGRERDRMVLPVEEVVARRVPPVDGVVVGTARVVLIEDVVRAVPLDETVRVVQPVRGRREVVARAVVVAAEGRRASRRGRRRLFGRPTSPSSAPAPRKRRQPARNVSRPPSAPGRVELDVRADAEDGSRSGFPLDHGHFGRAVDVASEGAREHVRAFREDVDVSGERLRVRRATGVEADVVEGRDRRVVGVLGLPERSDGRLDRFGADGVRGNGVDVERFDRRQRLKGQQKRPAVARNNRRTRRLNPSTAAVRPELHGATRRRRIRRGSSASCTSRQPNAFDRSQFGGRPNRTPSVARERDHRSAGAQWSETMEPLTIHISAHYIMDTGSSVTRNE